jgi:LysR family glycine cleavage system transcriptional activator
MSRAPPPLNALKAFEAAARHSNFARAASELNVTSGALSHQIRHLEALLGVTLFERRARGVALTAPGKALFPGLSAGFALIRDAVDSLRGTEREGVLVVSTSPGFTAKWLAPRLHRFAQAHPEIELRIASSSAYANFVTDGVDLAVRNIPNGQPRDPALAYEKLIDDALVAVCSPRLLAGLSGAKLRQALRDMPLIHDDNLAGRPEVPTWADWFSLARLPAPDVQRGLRLSSADHAIEAAIEGAGMLLTHALIAHDELAGGRLVMPLRHVLPAGRAYFVVGPKPRQAQPAVQAFRDWLKAEVAALRASAPRGRPG